MVGLARLLPAKRPAGWSSAIRCCLVAGSLLSANMAAGADQRGSFAGLEENFQRQARPVLAEYCLECHSSEAREGEVDLERFTSLADVRQDPPVWERVVEMLDNGEMPPDDSPQPARDQKERLRGWAELYLEAEARANAGDPGPVVLRRLSNAEYTYTIRDLTGVSLNPARHFPLDGAAGEGFCNTGTALAMSPALLSKYVDAARRVADHAVLLPTGIRFSRSTMKRDWVNETLSSIRQLYARYTGRIGDANLLNRWNVNDPTRLTASDGRVELEAYFRVLMQNRERVPQSDFCWDDIARTHRLSARYLHHLAEMLAANDPSSLLLERIRQAWRATDSAESIAAEVTSWQQQLWAFHPVGHFGQVQRWQEPATPLSREQAFRIPLQPSDDKQDVTIYLAASTAGDGNASDVAVWTRPRIERPDHAPLLLRYLRGASMEFEGRPGQNPDHPSPRHSEVPSSPNDGLDPRRFGDDAGRSALQPEDLCVHAPSVIEVTIPGELAGGDFVVSGGLGDGSDASSSVQLRVTTERPSAVDALLPGYPVLVQPNGAADERFRRSFEDFRELFPAAMCYPRIVPVDVVVTLVLFHREDEPLYRLMLDDGERAQLDRMWDELHYVSQDALKIVTAFEQLLEFASQDDDPQKYKPLGEAIYRSAAEFRARLAESEPRHLDALVEFAGQAFRRPLTDTEQDELRRLYAEQRSADVSHDDALRLTMARVLAAPAFLYKIEQPAPGRDAHPISDWELATRLSYFLWSSLPDETLRKAAAEDDLHESRVLLRQVRRMQRDARVRRMAIQFGCQWLQIRDFDEKVEKNERLYPEFEGIRRAMYEEAIRFFTHLFQSDGSIIDILRADYTFLNEALARHYGIPGVEGPSWRRVDGVGAHSRGGILAQAAILAAQSGVSRTSPILRGNWVSETLLGERLPRPPKDVPQLPDVVPEGLTERELIERHSSDAACAKCHARIDPYGFALEGFDTIGRLRVHEPDRHRIDTRATLADGTQVEGIEGLRNYLATSRRQAFVRHFCRKLLGFALGRAVQLSDKPLLDRLEQDLARNNYRLSRAIESIVLSRQFRSIRGRDHLAAGSAGPAADRIAAP